MINLLLALGLFVDLIAATYIVGPGIPKVRENHISLNRSLGNVDEARKRLLDPGSKRSRLSGRDPGYQKIAMLFERNCEIEIHDSDIIESRGHGASVGILENGSTFSSPVMADEFNEWIDSHIDTYLRRNGFFIFIVGFLIMLVSVV